MKFYRARIATRGVSGAGSPSRRVRRGPPGRLRPRRRRRRRGVGRDATASWYHRTRDISRDSRRTGGTPRVRHATHTSRNFQDGSARAGFLEVLEGDTGKMRGSRKTRKSRRTRVGGTTASRVSTRHVEGGFTRTTNVLNLALRRGFIPLRASMTRVDARRDRAWRASANGRWRGFARRSRRFLLSATRARWVGVTLRSATESTTLSARAGLGWCESEARRRRRRRRGRERRGLGRLASRGCDATARAVRSTRRGINRRPGINPRWTRTRRDSVGTRARGGACAGRGG